MNKLEKLVKKIKDSYISPPISHEKDQPTNQSSPIPLVENAKKTIPEPVLPTLVFTTPVESTQGQDFASTLQQSSVSR